MSMKIERESRSRVCARRQMDDHLYMFMKVGLEQKNLLKAYPSILSIVMLVSTSSVFNW